jgi:hypothetical protein
MRCALLAVALLCGCRSFDPKHPLVGQPRVDNENFGYWVWFEDGFWRLRFAAGNKPHRFQGSLAGVHGGVTLLAASRADLKDRIAVVGEAVQFDVDAAAQDLAGFDAQIAGGSCARFDLYVDGKYRPEQVRLGPRAMTTHRVPFERCP